MRPSSLVRIQLIEQLIHLLGIDPWLQAINEGTDPEWRRPCRSLGHFEACSQDFVGRGIEVFAAALRYAVEALGDIGIEREGGAHDAMMRTTQQSVKTDGARLQGCVKVHLLSAFLRPKTLTPTLSHPHSRPPERGRRHPRATTRVAPTSL
jgi:hypothetical protein